MKKMFCLFLGLILFVLCACPVSALSAASAIAVECSSFDVYYDTASRAKREIASVTKVMTVVLALELCADRTQRITIPDHAIGIEGTSIYLKAGEQLTVDDLIWAVLLNSANDAATALAVTVGGSMERFVSLMNAKAKALCMTDTVYCNPHGLPQEGHVSSARDQALLACYALSVPGFVEISSSYTHSIPYDGVENGRHLVNHNRLLRSYDGCIGMKTGFTKSAGRCLVTAAEREGVSLVCVTLHASDDWNDHRYLLDTGFTLFERVTLSCAEEQGAGVPVAGMDQVVLCTNPYELNAVLRKERGSISKVLVLPRFAYASIEIGQNIGRVDYLCDGKLVGRMEVLTVQEFS